MTELKELVEQAREDISQPDTLDIDNFIVNHPLPADQHPAAVYVALLSKKCTKKAIRVLNKIAKFFTNDRLDAVAFNWGNLRYQHIMAFRARLHDQHKPGYVNYLLAHLRTIAFHAWQLGHMSAEDYQRIKTVRDIPHTDETFGRAVSTKDIERLFNAFPDGMMGDRDRAIVALLYGCGLRRNEICTLQMCDYDRELNRIRVHRKFSLIQYVYLSKGVKAALETWIDYTGELKHFQTPMFFGLGKVGITGDPKPMVTHSVWNIVKKAAKAAHIQDFTPHDLRRTYCTNLLENKVDIAIVQRLMGHKKIETTIKYDRRGEEAKVEAVKMLDDIPIPLSL